MSTKITALQLFHGGSSPVTIHDIQCMSICDLPVINTDFGDALYLSLNPVQAIRRATRGNSDGWLTSFTLNLSNLRVLDFDFQRTSPLRWIAELIYNRYFKYISLEERDYIINNWRMDTKGYDIIIGYATDDFYLTILEDFFINKITLAMLCDTLLLYMAGKQYAMKTRQALAALKFIDSKRVLKKVWFPRQIAFHYYYKQQYHSSKYKPKSDAGNELYFSQMIKKGIKADDLTVSTPSE